MSLLRLKASVFMSYDMYMHYVISGVLQNFRSSYFTSLAIFINLPLGRPMRNFYDVYKSTM